MSERHLKTARDRLHDAERHFTYQNYVISRLEEGGRPIADAETLLLRLRVTVVREQETLEALLEGILSAVDRE